MKKITSANESEIDTLSISTNLKTIFHTAIDEGRIIFTPTKPVTYGAWNGLFYILVDFEGGNGSYVIGEGLNGGYSICGMPGRGGLCQWTQNFFDLLVPTAYAAGVTSTVTVPSQRITIGQGINIVINFFIFGGVPWSRNFFFKPITTGPQVITAQMGGGTAPIVVVPVPNPLKIVDRIYPGCGKNANGVGLGNCTVTNRKAEDITQIVLHFTVDGGVNTTLGEFNMKSTLGTNAGKSSHYIVDRDGEIYQLVNDKDLAWHAGCRQKVGEDCVNRYENNTKTIGIEINNWGPLRKEGDLYKNASGGVFTPSNIRKIYPEQILWHNYNYWEDFYTKQLESINLLIDSLVDKYSVNKIFYELNGEKNILDYETDESKLNNFSGIVGHSNIGIYKHDPGPAFQNRFFELLNIDH